MIGENFPYTNFHDMNLDWMIKIAKDFLDQYTSIQETISQGLEDISDKTETGLADLQTKYETLEGLLDAWYTEHSEDIAGQLADALADLNAWYTLHTGYLDDILTTKIAAFNTAAEAKAAATLESIPADYTAVGVMAQYAKNGIDVLADNLYNPASSTDGFRIDGAGSPIAATGYFISGWIPVSEGKQYIKNSPEEDTYHRYICLDANGDYINGSLGNENKIVLAAGSAYIRICGASEEINTTVVFCSAKDDYARYEIENIITAGIDTRNLFDDDSADDNIRLDASGNPISANGYYSSDWIRCVPGASYKKNSPTEDAYHRICFYNKDRLFISATNNNSMTAPSNAQFIKFCGISTEKESAVLNIISGYDAVARYESNPGTGTVLQCTSLLGYNGVKAYYDTVSAGVAKELGDFPFYIKKNVQLSVFGKFNSFSGFKIGKGYRTYRGDWIEITSSEVIFYHYENNVENIMKRVNHGLTISEYIAVTMILDNDFTINCIINTLSGTFKTYLETNSNAFAGKAFFISLNNMTDTTFSASSKDICKPLWIIGDSYIGYTDDRPMKYIKEYGFDNILVDSLAGLESERAYPEFKRLLHLATPKYLIWYIGMNDTTEQYETYYDIIKEMCDAYKITLILNKLPTTPIVNNEAKNTFIDGTGLRYINSYSAVGASSDGDWYPGYLSPYDNVHPTNLGAQALAMRMIVDVPEIAEYK